MNTRFRRTAHWIVAVALLFVIGACGAPPAGQSPATDIPAPVTPVTETPTEATQPVETPDNTDAVVDALTAILNYRGPQEMGSPDTSKCAGWTIDEDGAVSVSSCDGSTRSETLGDHTAAQWDEIRSRFAPFAYETPTETLSFEGAGSETADVWQPALLAWSRGRFAEISTGRTSATINTAMSWHLGQDFTQKNICMHLTVLDYGYAYAEERLCEGQDAVSVAEGWLTTDELAALNTWLYQRAPLYVDNNYIDGKGEQEMSQSEVEDATRWATALWTRLRDSQTVVSAPPPNACPEAREGMGMLRNFQRGYCLLVPNTHTVFEPNPDEQVIAQESLLNVTEPRAYIAVRDADGQDVEEAADAVAADFAGFEIVRSNEEIAGHPAVVLDNVPGQDLNRRVLIIVDDRLYDLTFAPLDHPRMEEFYAAIIGDLALIEPE